MEPLVDPSASVDLELRLVRLARAPGALRAALAHVAAAVVERRAWEPLGYARLRDYAAEKLGTTERHVLDLANVGRALGYHPALESALLDGALTFAKVRLLARVAGPERWIPFARRLTADALSREVRRVDRESVEGVPLDGIRRRLRFDIRCTSRVLAKWREAENLCRRMSGSTTGGVHTAEWVAAEVLSALPDIEAAGAWAGEPERDRAAPRPEPAPPEPPVEPAPFDVAPYLDRLDDVDAFTLDSRLRDLLQHEQRLEAAMGPLLAAIWRSGVPRRLGYATLEAYALERLGIDPAKARALVRIERAAQLNGALATAYRSGALSWVKAQELVAIVAADPEDRWASAWVDRAQEITVRELRDDAERALDLRQQDPAAWAEHGGLRREVLADPDRVIGAHASAPQSDVEDCVLTLWCLREDKQLLHAVLASVRRLVERTTRLPTEGEALEVMLDHVITEWRWDVPKHFAVFDRDEWRCGVPGCTSMRNLHDHHIHYRSRGGSNALENRTTLCAWHHLRGVHGGILKVEGRAPDALRFRRTGDTTSGTA